MLNRPVRELVGWRVLVRPAAELARGLINVSDVLKVIQIALVNGPDVQDPMCLRTRGDVNDNGVVDVNDVLYLIKTAFINGPNPVNPCGP